MFAHRLNLLADAHGENAAAPMTLATLIFIDRHRDESPVMVIPANV
jgi:hypothetical protein